MVQISYIPTIKLFYDMVAFYNNKYNQYDFDISPLSTLHTKWVYRGKYDQVFNRTTYTSEDLIEFILNNKFYNISSWKDEELPDDPPGFNYVWFMVYPMNETQLKKLKIIFIQRAWRKYFLKKVKVKNDLVIHGLAEYFGHPSRLSFEI
jgi:hypothetical protein